MLITILMEIILQDCSHMEIRACCVLSASLSDI